MALLPKKTYSRRNNELCFSNEVEKENVDPFDELLSSPLKQEVHFQPLSFWGKKVKLLESKEKSKKFDYGLFEASDSDEINASCLRNKKQKTKYSQSKARTVHPKSKSQKFYDRRKNHSTAYSFIKQNKEFKSVFVDKSKSSGHTKEFEKLKSHSLNNNLDQEYNNETMVKTNLFNNTCNTSQCTSINVNFSKTNVNNNSMDFNNNNFDSVSLLRDCKKDVTIHKDVNFNKPKNLSFQIYNDTNTLHEQSGVVNGRSVIHSSEDESSSTIPFDENEVDTLTSFQSGDETFKFVNKKRHFNYPNCCNMHYKDLNSLHTVQNCTSVSILSEEPKEIISPRNNPKLKSANVLHNDDETLVNFGCDTTQCLSCDNDAEKTFCIMNKNTVSFESEKSKQFVLECMDDSSVFDGVDFLHLSETELEDLFLEFLNGSLEDGLVESSSTSEDTLSSISHESTVIKIGSSSKTNVCQKSFSESGVEEDATLSNSNAVPALTTGISELSITDSAVEGVKESEAENAGNMERGSNYEDNSISINLQNATTTRRSVLNDRYGNDSYNRKTSVSRRQTKGGKEAEEDLELDKSVQVTGRMSLDWNQTISFANPVFESTRVFDTDPTDKKEQRSRSESKESFLQDHTFALKPGKKWLRSMSVLKQLQNGSIAGGRLESTRVTGRKFESFVQDLLEIQNGSGEAGPKKKKSSFFTTLVDTTVSDNTVMDATLQNKHLFGRRRTILEPESSHLETSDVDGSVSSSNNSILQEKSALNFTVKIINPKAEPSAFRSALGVDSNLSKSAQNSVQGESSAISARDFILLQCGQEDVLSFEEYFNEKTLKNCRKIGEGVYGEVFMTSEAVIKIIPIEGADKVNGEPQKTFEEIISEVVIASKLSNLRSGEKHRTDGFSELKRCWCVKGKYPKYLMQLWDEYDQAGSGSENDSPIMFKNDQLYIVLELSNGGKDLESYVFSSSAQSLSLFIQMAYSLAVAEKAFEFEHRDLHWGNVLISDTKDKFTNVILDGVEYKIPTKGVKVCIIDFTLSRISHEGCCIFNDLSVDPSLFVSEGDYQFEIYRLMLREVQNDWSLFRPKTNLFWLHYTIDKMIKMVHYKNKKTKVHAKHLKDLKGLECVVLEHEDSTDLVLSEFLVDVINKL